MGLISNETARTLDPDIEDAILEGELVEMEGLRKSLLTGLEQQAAQAQLDPSVIAKIAVYKRKGMNLEDAVIQTHKDMQAQQQSQADAAQQQQQQQPDPNAQPGMGVSPDNPIQGAQQPTGKPSLQDMLQQLHQPPVNTQQNAVSMAAAPTPPGV
jgi:hypothetical protein